MHNKVDLLEGPDAEGDQAADNTDSEDEAAASLAAEASGREGGAPGSEAVEAAPDAAPAAAQQPESAAGHQQQQQQQQQQQAAVLGGGVAASAPPPPPRLMVSAETGEGLRFLLQEIDRKVCPVQVCTFSVSCSPLAMPAAVPAADHILSTLSRTYVTEAPT